MIHLRRDDQRHCDRRHRNDVWLTFWDGDPEDPLDHGFGALEFFDEDRIAPGAIVPRHAQSGAEVVTYVREGALAFEDSRGKSAVMRAGEFRRTTAEPGLRHGETNASRTFPAHAFQIGLRAAAGLEFDHEWKRFSAGERRGGLRVVASPDARQGSLRLRQDVSVYSALLDPGKHVVHELSEGRGAWLHIVLGEAAFGNLVLASGDGAGITAERAVSLTARNATELLLIDVPETNA